MITNEECKNCGHAGHDHSDGGACHWLQRGALPTCSCIAFVSPTAEAISALPESEQELLACANYLGIDPGRISKVETTTDGGGHFTGIDVTIHILTGRQVGQWVTANIPKEKLPWTEEYFEKKGVAHPISISNY